MVENFKGKRILHVIPYFAPAWSYGGPVKAAYDFAKKLASLGFKVSVATTDVLDASRRNKVCFEVRDGIEIHRFKNLSNRLAKKFNFYCPFGFSKWLNNNVKDFDIVHIHEIFTLQSLVALKACHRSGVPYVVQPHGSLNSYAKNSRFKFIKKVLIRYFKKYIRDTRGIIALNNNEKQSIAVAYPGLDLKVKIVPNGIEVEAFKKIRPVNLHRLFKVSPENKFIAFLGRIYFQKGLDLSLKALALLKNKTSFTFLIIGPDEGEKRKLISLAKKLGIQKNVVFAGILVGNKKLEILKGADLSLLLSRSEGLPTSLLESAALGLPIVCSPNANLPEVTKFKAGFEVENEADAARAVEKILSDKKLKQQLSKNAFKLAGSFDIAQNVLQLVKAYKIK